MSSSRSLSMDSAGRRSRWTRRPARFLAALTLLAAVLPATMAQADDPPADPPVRLAPVRIIGGSGHANLYPWGMATRSDGSVLVSDYWNYRVQHYSKAGALLGTVIPKESSHEAPYDLGVDLRDDSIYLGDADTATVDKYDKDGHYLSSVGGPSLFNYPAWVEVDAVGRLAVADGRKHKIAVFSDTGTLLYQFGSLGSAPGQFDNPRGLAFGSDGRLFVADTGNRRIQAFTITDTGATFTNEWAVTGDARGLTLKKGTDTTTDVLYLVNTGVGKIQRFSTDGSPVGIVPTDPTIPYGFGDGRGRGITIDGDNNVWVADMPQFQMRKYSAAGQLLAHVPDPEELPPPGRFAMPGSAAVDADGNIVVSDTFNWRVQKLDPQGNYLNDWGFRRARNPGGGDEFGMNYARGIAVDRNDGTIILGNTDGQDLRKYGPDGSFIWLMAGVKAFSVDVAPDGTIYAPDFGSDTVKKYQAADGARTGPAMGAGHLSSPVGISLDPDGSIWVSNRKNGKIVHLSAAGDFLGEFGSLGTTDDTFVYPADIETDADFVYVADQQANRIKVFRKDGTFVASLLLGGPGFGRVLGPAGLDLTPQGRLYVTEQTGERISEFAVLRPGEIAPPEQRPGTTTTTTTAPPTTTTTAPTTTTTAPTTTTTAAPTTTTTGPAAAAGEPGPVGKLRSGYWMLGSDGAVYAFGDAVNHGSVTLGGKAVDIEPTPTGNGYWILDRAGLVTAKGDATSLGHAGPLVPGEEATSLSATPNGSGYWIFTNKGRVVPLGTAKHLGDMSKTTLNGPVLDSIVIPSGNGYYMVGSDGGIFAFGDARYYGSMGDQKLNAPVESLVPDPDGTGYWLVASDGGIFAFESLFKGSMGARKLNAPVTGMVPYGNGYLMVATDGGTFNFSDKLFAGSLGGNPPKHPVTAIAALD